MLKITVKKSPTHGNGVYAKNNIKKNETIEICPIIKLNKKDTKIIDQTFLYNYYYDWTGGNSAIALGYGSIYNHSYQPNAQYHCDHKNNTVTVKALRIIKVGEEITTNYNHDPKSQKKVWFDK